MNRAIKIVVAAALCALFAGTSGAVDWKGALGTLTDKAAELKDKSKKDDPKKDADPAPAGSPGAPAATPATFKAYQNYDFVPGDKIVFEDDFAADMDGEFPAHWKLKSGQGAVNRMEGRPVMTLTEGNYAKVVPRIRQAAYLGDPFTVEFDFYPEAGSYEAVNVFLEQGDEETIVRFGHDVETSYFAEDSANLSARYPDSSEFTNRWHHAALVVRNGQLKAYLDQFRVLVVPDIGSFKPESVQLGGIGGNETPILFTNVRIANGGSANLVDQLTRDGKVVTHGILFDVGQSVVKPESMGTVRQIVSAMKSNAALKLEIGGHTDSDGDAARNVTLSQARADAVRKVIADQGIDASRLTTKGYGQGKPIDSNATPEGKANNRRVEFVKT